MIKIGDSLFHWNNVKAVQSMGTSEDKNDFIFEPSVTWQCKVLKFTVSVMSDGEANLNSRLTIGYAFENLSDHPALILRLLFARYGRFRLIHITSF